ncbi:unnamed protein product, partial [marine sediment metagenome]
GQAASDITLTFDFIDKLDWQPCMELEPATEVTIKLHSVNDDVVFVKAGVSFTCLEITV